MLITYEIETAKIAPRTPKSYTYTKTNPVGIFVNSNANNPNPIICGYQARAIAPNVLLIKFRGTDNAP